MRMFGVAVAALLLALPAQAEEIRTLKSKYSVTETLDRLSATLAEKGNWVMGRVNHAAGANAVGLKLKPTEL